MTKFLSIHVYDERNKYYEAFVNFHHKNFESTLSSAGEFFSRNLNLLENMLLHSVKCF